MCISGLSVPVVPLFHCHVYKSWISAPRRLIYVCIFGLSAPVVLLSVRHVYGSVFCHADFLLKRFLYLINCSIFVERIRKVILTLIVDIVYNNRCVRRVNVLTYHKSNIMKKYSFREAEAKCEATFSYT